jgi:hypothetical protein
MATPDTPTADTDNGISVGKGEQPAWLTPGLANRHGLVTGATGTGKTVALQVMAEGFARAGVPVFAAGIKGDRSGISEVGERKDFILKRTGDMGPGLQPGQFSTVSWDVLGEQGHPVRATVSEMQPHQHAGQNVDRPGHCAKRDTLGHQQGGRRSDCRPRKVGRRIDRRLGRPSCAARLAGFCGDRKSVHCGGMISL